MFPDEAIVVTQSGETADVLYAMRRLKSAGIKTLGACPSNSLKQA
jgi:glucosamine 6-phosphate synthetase-like amidotransferase/phosphosugar isomerase protein